MKATRNARSTTRLPGEQRREVIIRAARRVFVEKGFDGTTTRELAEAAGVSEALLFKHFPSKEALYGAIQISCFKEEGARMIERLEALAPSASTLVFLVHHMVSHMLAERVPDENERSFVRLVLRSLMDDGEFARVGLQTAVDGPVRPSSGAWFVNQMVAMVMIHLLPTPPAIDFGASREKVVEQAVWFSLRGLGLKEEAIERYLGGY
ncbi:MAG: helix-turn-helix domain containing protein [Planctomycetota bacterium]|nr:helix-turn-helix domain containing protein [Planctomycetota bacterium]